MFAFAFAFAFAAAAAVFAPSASPKFYSRKIVLVDKNVLLTLATSRADTDIHTSIRTNARPKYHGACEDNRGLQPCCAVVMLGFVMVGP